jgi:CBS domain-containing protein
MQVHQVMTPHVKCIGPSTTLDQAAAIMRELDVGALPVGDGNPTGILTDRDIVVRAVADGRDPVQTRARDIITPRVCSIYQDQNIEDASELMSKERIRRVLVLDRQQRPVGILSLGDLSRASAEGSAQVALEGVTRPGQATERRATHP